MSKAPPPRQKYSYTSEKMGIRGRIADLWMTYKLHGLASDAYVEERLLELRSDIEEMHKQFDFIASGKRVLEVGPGAFLIQARYLARENEVFAIDTDIISEGTGVGQIFKILYENGVLRGLKTAARKLLGIDRTRRSILRRHFAVDSLPKVAVMHGSVTNMDLESASFDLVYSRAVLHSVAEPQSALSEIARVLRPGGVAFVRLHLYTSHNGCLDSRLVVNDDRELYWGHLRGFAMRPNASLNRLRLEEWRKLFHSYWPGCILQTVESYNPYVPEEASRLKSEGELAEYTREELVTSTVVAMWKKR